MKSPLQSVLMMTLLMLSSSQFLLAGTQGANGQIPRPEHPKPQFHRDAWLNLNGQWNFAFDFDLSGVQKGWPGQPSGLDKKIMVPFCPESKLSGIAFTEFIPAVWYHRTFNIPQDWKDRRIFLHFGGVDYDCRAWINGQSVGRHYGGAASFSFEITDTLLKGDNDLVVCAVDDICSGIQPRGKQSIHLKPSGITYTRVTGIWQTVWLEARPKNFIESVRIVPDLDGSRFIVTPVINKYHRGITFQATLFSDQGKKVATARSSSTGGVPLTLEIKKPRPWSPADPYLYKLTFELFEKNRVVDVVDSYAGLRKIHIEGNKIFLNNKPIFLRFVLDQGYYPEGVWTAPTDGRLKADIELSMAIGFNGARLHQKVFEERFHYWADRLGYLTWGEFYDWGLGEVHKIDKPVSPQAVRNHQREWREVVLRDLNHPSIITWTPFNETGDGARVNLEKHRRALRETVNLTKALDPTRPVIDSSGHIHVETDIESVHDYEQDMEVFRKHYNSLDLSRPDTVYHSDPDITAAYKGQPYIVGEYGGTFWADEYPQKEPVDKPFLVEWGYGKDIKLFLNHLEALTTVMTNNPNIAGFCYTQLYDVEGEINGLYDYDRKLKFNGNHLKKIFQSPAAIEAN